MIAQITDQSVPFQFETDPLAKDPAPIIDSAKENRAKKLLAYAKKQIEEGKREIGIKYLRRIVNSYDETLTATEARILLKELRESEPVREWLDRTGKHSVRATFLRLENELVYLRREDERVIAVNVADFSHTDRLYIIHREGLSSLKSSVAEELL